jgi:hypothetical protein
MDVPLALVLVRDLRWFRVCKEGIASKIRTQIYYIPWDHRFLVRSQAGAVTEMMRPGS